MGPSRRGCSTRRRPRQGPDGTHPIWLDPKFVDRLDQMRAGAGESYSDVILRLVMNL